VLNSVYEHLSPFRGYLFFALSPLSVLCGEQILIIDHSFGALIKTPLLGVVVDFKKNVRGENG